MSTNNTVPAIQYHGPDISVEVPWETRRHLQLLYQKLGNHTQAFALIKDSIAAVQQKFNAATSSGAASASASSSSSSTTSTSLGQTNNQTGSTSYSTQQGDNGSFVIVSSGSAIAVSLTTQAPPWFFFVVNQGAGTATLTPASGTISYGSTSGAANMPVAGGDSAVVAFDGTNWWAIPVAPSGGGSGFIYTITQTSQTSGAGPTTMFTAVAGATYRISVAAWPLAQGGTSVSGESATVDINWTPQLSGSSSSFGAGVVNWASGGSSADTTGSVICISPAATTAVEWETVTLVNGSPATLTSPNAFGFSVTVERLQ